MKNNGYARYILAAAVLLSGLAVLSAPVASYADDDDRGSRHGASAAGIPENAAYKQECSSCHVLYHPGLLPARSWDAIIGGSSKHFGENLSLDDKTAAELKAYFNSNSAEHSRARFSHRILSSLGHGVTPGRITEVPFIQKEHRKVGKVVFARPSIKSFSNCGACHPDAANGDFEEDNVSIPK